MSIFNKYIIYAIISFIMISGASIVTYVYQWKESIKREAVLQFNNAQLQQNLLDQKKFSDSLKSINDIQKDIIDNITKQNQDLTIKLSGLNTYLGSDQAASDSHESSDVIKKTLEALGAQK